MIKKERGGRRQNNRKATQKQKYKIKQNILKKEKLTKPQRNDKNKTKQTRKHAHMQKKQEQNQTKQKAREQPEKQKNPKTKSNNQVLFLSFDSKNKTKAVCQLKNKARKQYKLIKLI